MASRMKNDDEIVADFEEWMEEWGEEPSRDTIEEFIVNGSLIGITPQKAREVLADHYGIT